MNHFIYQKRAKIKIKIKKQQTANNKQHEEMTQFLPMKRQQHK